MDSVAGLAPVGLEMVWAGASRGRGQLALTKLRITGGRSLSFHPIALCAQSTETQVVKTMQAHRIPEDNASLKIKPIWVGRRKSLEGKNQPSTLGSGGEGDLGLNLLVNLSDAGQSQQVKWLLWL